MTLQHNKIEFKTGLFFLLTSKITTKRTAAKDKRMARMGPAGHEVNPGISHF